MNIERYAAASVVAIVSFLMLVGMAIAVSDTAGTTASVSVNEFLSVTITSGAPVLFGDLADDTSDNQAENDPLTATIGAETNIGSIDVRTSADTATFSGPGTLAVGNMKWSDALGGTYTSYTTSAADVCTGLSASQDCDIYHQISIPDNQPAGSYSVGITITATNE